MVPSLDTPFLDKSRQGQESEQHMGEYCLVLAMISGARRPSTELARQEEGVTRDEKII